MTRRVELPSSPEVQLLGDSAVFRGAAALDAYRLVSEAIGVVRRRDHIEPSGRMLQILAALKGAADAARSPDLDMQDIQDVQAEPTSASLRSGERVGVEEAARMLRVTRRHACRLAPSVGATKAGNRWAFDRGLVQAYIDIRDGVR